MVSIAVNRPEQHIEKNIYFEEKNGKSPQPD